MTDFAKQIADAEQLAQDTASAMEAIRPPNSTTPLEQLQGKERRDVEGWIKDVGILLHHVDCLRAAKSETAPMDERERSLGHAVGGLTALKMLAESCKRTGKTLLENLTPPEHL